MNQATQATAYVPVFVAVITAASALLIAAITYFLTKRRERDAEWRKFKLEYYREYVAALSGIMEGNITQEGKRRFASAANDLALVAPPHVLHAAYALIAEVNNPARTEQSSNASLSSLFRELRKDTHPVLPFDADLTFQLFSGSPPDMLESGETVHQAISSPPKDA